MKKTWRVHLRQETEGIVDIDADYVGDDATAYAVKDYALDSETLSHIDWEYASAEVEKCYLLGARCEFRDDYEYATCQVHDDQRYRGNACWVRDREVNARWEERKDRIKRRKEAEWKLAHHTVVYLAKLDSVGWEHRCVDCGWSAGERPSFLNEAYTVWDEARLEHCRIPLEGPRTPEAQKWLR